MVKADDGVSAAGPSLLEKLWDELDTIMDCLKMDGPPTANEYGFISGSSQDRTLYGPSEAWQAWGELRGQAQGVAFAIAIIENPYYPSVPNVKARAVDRWEERQE